MFQSEIIVVRSLKVLNLNFSNFSMFAFYLILFYCYNIYFNTNNQININLYIKLIQ